MDAAATTTRAVRQERRDGVLLLIMAERPINTLSANLRAGLAEGLAAAADPSVRAVVICSALAVFSSGVETAGTGAAPGLAALCQQIESMAKPVVVALNGNALGGGMEIALAAHGRVAQEAARLGFPEVSLGGVPQAGATQRLPRLVGAEAALRLLLDPGPVTAAQALAIGLVDSVVVAGLIESAVSMAEQMADALGGRAPRKTSDRRDGFRDPKAYQAAIAAARAQHVQAHLPAAGQAIDCVEAAQLLLFEQGLAFEEQAAAMLEQTPQAAGLRHVLAAEQLAAQVPQALARVALPEIKAIALWGGGARAAEVALQALTRGLRVALIEPDRAVLVKTVEQIAARQAAAVAEGRLTEAARDADWARLGSSMVASDIGGVDLVLASVEAGRLPVQTEAPVMPLGALPAQAVAGRMGLQAAVAAGMPAELGFTDGADVRGLALGLGLARRLGWRVFFTGPGGPMVQRLRAALSAAIAAQEASGVARETVMTALSSFGIGVAARAVLPKPTAEGKAVLDACLGAIANQGARLVGEGVARRPAEVDAVAVAAGLFPRWQGGPMFWADRRGLLVLRSDLRHRAEAAPQIYTPAAIFDALIAEGRNFAALDRVKV